MEREQERERYEKIKIEVQRITDTDIVSCSGGKTYSEVDMADPYDWLDTLSD